MSKKVNTSAKANVIENKANVAETKQSGLSEINLAKIAKIAESASLKIQGSKSHLYNYPAEINTKEKINGLEGKNFRNARRAELKKFANNAIIYVHRKDDSSLSALIAEFKKHYELHYSVNDLSINSICNSNDAEKRGTIELFLDIVKSH